MKNKDKFTALFLEAKEILDQNHLTTWIARCTGTLVITISSKELQICREYLEELKKEKS